jgi:structure-specific endonuclease subunit SLX1
MWSVYLLQEVGGSRTYVGATLDVDRRLNQHNGNQSGGAKATHGKQWSRLCHITGFPDERAALQFEWSWKHTSRKQVGTILERRIKALFVLLGCDQPTSKAMNFQDYVKDLEVVWETGLDPMKFI